MNRARRAVSVCLLTLAVAVPATAAPSPLRVASKERVLTTLWARLTTLVGVFDSGRAGADPDGTTTTPPTTNSQAEEGDSRPGADPDGGAPL
jgi:hypothetical protein